MGIKSISLIGLFCGGLIISHALRAESTISDSLTYTQESKALERKIQESIQESLNKEALPIVVGFAEFLEPEQKKTYISEMKRYLNIYKSHFLATMKKNRQFAAAVTRGYLEGYLPGLVVTGFMNLLVVPTLIKLGRIDLAAKLLLVPSSYSAKALFIIKNLTQTMISQSSKYGLRHYSALKKSKEAILGFRESDFVHFSMDIGQLHEALDSHESLIIINNKITDLSPSNLLSLKDLKSITKKPFEAANFSLLLTNLLIVLVSMLIC